MIAPTMPTPGAGGPSVSTRLLTLREVAERTTLSPRSVRVLVARGVLPVVRLTTRRVAVTERDLLAWIDARASRWSQASQRLARWSC